MAVLFSKIAHICQNLEIKYKTFRFYSIFAACNKGKRHDTGTENKECSFI